ncbi:MAG: hypothetical protein NHB15_16500 [Methanosarcina barkeri]|nr:hypothetical protein [Methanosarcina sp. ERenArc_MAG2]
MLYRYKGYSCRKRGIKSNIPVNKRNPKKKERRRSIKVDLEEYKKKSAIEKFFSRIGHVRKYFQDISKKYTLEL